MDATLEAAGLILQGMDLAASDPRWGHETGPAGGTDALRSPPQQLLTTSSPCARRARRWAFLVYNGSVHYHAAVQALQRDGVRAQLLASQDRVCQVSSWCAHAPASCC